MKEIKTREELKEAFRKPKSVVMFGKHDCLHCTIMSNCIQSVERHFPLIDFYFTDVKEFSDERHIDAFPVTYLNENGSVMATLVGSKYATRVRDIFSLWFLKD